MTVHASTPDVLGVEVRLGFFPVNTSDPKLRPWSALSRLKPSSLVLLSG